MAIKFVDVVKQGKASVLLNTENPSVDGFDAGIGSVGISTNGVLWYKTGAADTNWVRVVSSDSNSNMRISNDGNFQLKDVGTNEWRTVWFNNGSLQIGESET